MLDLVMPDELQMPSDLTSRMMALEFLEPMKKYTLKQEDINGWRYAIKKMRQERNWNYLIRADGPFFYTLIVL